MCLGCVLLGITVFFSIVMISIAKIMNACDASRLREKNDHVPLPSGCSQEELIKQAKKEENDRIREKLNKEADEYNSKVIPMEIRVKTIDGKTAVSEPIKGCAKVMEGWFLDQPPSLQISTTKNECDTQIYLITHNGFKDKNGVIIPYHQIAEIRTKEIKNAK